MNTFPINLSHHGGNWLARCIKRATLSTGYTVYLFERKSDKPVIGFLPYVVSVKSPIDTTSEWHTFDNCSRAVQYYINTVCCYA